MDLNLWLSILLAIPLSILANMLTPGVQALLDSYNKAKSLKRTKYLRDEYQLIKKFKEDRLSFHEYLFSVVIRATYVGSLIGIFVGLAFFIGSVPGLRIPDVARAAMYGLGQLITLIGSIMIVRICGAGLRTIFKVQSFEVYKESVLKNVGAID